MAFLDSTDWQIHPFLRDELVAATFGDFYMLDVFERSMELLHRHLRKGTILEHTKRILSEYPPIELTDPLNGYKSADLTDLFKLGKFRYDGDENRLCIWSMRHEHCDFAVGSAWLNDNNIEMNWRYFLEEAEENNVVFPNEPIGRERLAWEVAGIVLHEVVHNQGFAHPDYREVIDGNAAKLPNLVEARESEFDPQYEYFRSLPCVAEQAVYLIAKDDFAGTNFDPSRNRRWPTPCACHVRRRPKTDGPFGGMPLELPMSNDRDKSVGVRGHQDGR
ncbi:hypothetical protein [Rubripirellula reticaptiva]|uniref:Uncharacterized protein n=1 Tax=Rubripirellula reticaptiva TaxID=2528013 RepID=A0A5C6F8V1_9BACT|nr:hypothetical protein [Rubripirellula reticaptiva]TWU55941.1 hypothetical protein Poly59_22440 [Rubripirellula reticaptiva]